MLKYMSNLSPVIMVVVGLLLFFSVVSWAIIVYKLVQIRVVKKATKSFLDFFWETKDFAAINEGLGDFKDCPLAVVFAGGYRETEHFLETNSDGEGPIGLSADVSAIENVSRALRKITAQEVERLEKNLSFLATTASTTPFIGLFGTVWGIMIAFQSIGLAGSTSLDIVAPGIAEALITTAIGLAVAIPAVIGYNYLQSKIKAQVSEIDNFSYDFLNIAQKIFNAKK